MCPTGLPGLAGGFVAGRDILPLALVLVPLALSGLLLLSCGEQKVKVLDVK